MAAWILVFALNLGLGILPVQAQIAITDDTGRRVELPRPAARVIALYGAFNEIVAALGRAETLAARTRTDRLPREILDKPSIGTHMRPNVELVVGLRPDLVLQMSGRRGQAEEMVAALEARGVTVAVFDIHDFGGLFRTMERIGVLLGAQDDARTAVTGLRARLDAVAWAVAGAPRPKVFYEVRYPNLLAAGQRSMVSGVIRAAGGENCVDSPRKLVRLNEEELLRLDPDVYLLQRGPMNPDPLPPQQRPHFRTLAAVVSGRVHVLDEQIFSRPGPRSVDAVEQLAAILHPQLFSPEATP